jgi:YD repeat-containing protein
LADPTPVTLYSYDEVGNATTTTYTTAQDIAGGITSAAVVNVQYDGLNRVMDTSTPTGTQSAPGTPFHTVATYSLSPRTKVVQTPGGPNAPGSATGTTITGTTTYDMRTDVVVDQIGSGTNFLSATASTYDQLGRPATQTSNGITTSFLYNRWGQVTQRKCSGCLSNPPSPPGPVDTNTWYSYDQAGRMTQMTDSLGSGSGDANHTWTYTYDDDGRLATASLPQPLLGAAPNTGVTSVTYDAAGEKVKVVDGSSRERDFTYDPAGNLASLVSADGTTTYNYDSTDTKLTKTTFPLGKIVYSYDNLRRVTEEDGTLSGTTVPSDHHRDDDLHVHRNPGGDRRRPGGDGVLRIPGWDRPCDRSQASLPVNERVVQLLRLRKQPGEAPIGQ